MTVSSTTVKNSYSGNGSTTQFAYGFKIFADSDLIVIIRSSTGTETVKTLTTHYTVAGAGDASGGSITFTSGNTPASGETVVIIREVPQTQAIDYIANDPFPAESHEEGLDRATMTTQQVQEELNRSLKISRTNTMTSTEFTTSATDRANKVLSFDSSGELAVTQELGTYKGTDATVTTAAYNVRDIIKSTTTAQLNNVYICVADSVVGDSLTDTDHFELLVDAVSAATSATASATSATASASSATASASSASTASTQASNAASSATASANSATAAASSATDAAASADAFDDIYLGSKSSDPSTDNDGDALAAGMLYFNTTNDILRVYSGSAWQDAAISSTGVVTLTGTQTLTNKTLTSPIINSPTGDFIKIEGTNFTDSLLIGHATTGTLNSSDRNTGVGIESLDALTSGSDNTALGYLAGTAITTGNNNTFVGKSAGDSVTTAASNVGMGFYTLSAITTGANNNVAIGRSAMKDSNGSNCDDNVAIGNSALEDVTGAYNIGIGSGAGDNITSGAGNVIIGSVDAASATGDRQLKIAGNDGSTTTTWISGTNAGAITFNGAYTFPTSDGSANQVLQTNGSGALSFASASGGVNTPAFGAERSSSQSISDATRTTILFNNEFYDSSSAYDTSTGKFTPQTAGKYFVIANIILQSGSNSNFSFGFAELYKNTSIITESIFDDRGDENSRSYTAAPSAVVDMNGSSDFILIQAYINANSGTPEVSDMSTFTAFKIIE